MGWLDPTARNSNLLPVKAKGLVRLRSVASFSMRGRLPMPRSMIFWLEASAAAPFSMASRMWFSWAPRKADMMAGGASLAPRRWSLPAKAMEARSSPPWVWMAFRVALRK